MRQRPRKTPHEQLWGGVVRVEDGTSCWVTSGNNGNGYTKLSIWTPDGTRREYAHRLAWEEANGPIPAGLDVLHTCDNPPCIRNDGERSHLFIGTAKDNSADMVAKGRNAAITHPERVPRGERHMSRTRPDALVRGESHWSHKLTEAQVLEIRSLYASGTSIRRLALVYSVARSTIQCIVHRRTWKCVA